MSEAAVAASADSSHNSIKNHDDRCGDDDTATADSSYDRAAQALQRADYLLILAGAGMSADSGLGTYETMPQTYREYCNPTKLITHRQEFQTSWKDFALQYEHTKPHGGYSILDNWCDGNKLRGLSTSQKKNQGASNTTASKWWVYTSNVDGHFKKFPSFSGSSSNESSSDSDDLMLPRVCEIHGCANEFVCSCSMGYFDQEQSRRMGDLWDRWNDLVESIPFQRNCYTKKQSLQDLKARNDNSNNNDNDDDTLPNIVLPSCPHCNHSLPLRPNVLMFNDTDENILRPIQLQSQRYQDWEAVAESSVIEEGQNLVLIELGCGTNVPAVRQESEEVLRDTLDGIQHGGNESNSGSATLIRINPKDAHTSDAALAPHVVSLFDTSLVALRKIDAALDALQNNTNSVSTN